MRKLCPIFLRNLLEGVLLVLLRSNRDAVVVALEPIWRGSQDASGASSKPPLRVVRSK
jgi:hypothetical protein